MYKLRLLSIVASFVRLLDTILWDHGTWGSLLIQSASLFQRHIQAWRGHTLIGLAHMTMLHSRISVYDKSRCMTCSALCMCRPNQLWWHTAQSSSTADKFLSRTRSRQTFRTGLILALTRLVFHFPPRRPKVFGLAFSLNSVECFFANERKIGDIEDQTVYFIGGWENTIGAYNVVFSVMAVLPMSCSAKSV